MRSSTAKMGRISAFLAPTLGFSSILLAIAYSPWFNWENNALSDLGASGSGSLIFNTGLITTGVIALMFALALGESFRGKTIGRAGAGLFFLAGLFLSSIGIFPETSGTIHLYVSIGFFTTLGASLLVMGLQLFQESETRSFGIGTIALVILGVVGWLAPHNGVAIPEAISGIVASVWSVAAGYRLLGKK